MYSTQANDVELQHPVRYTNESWLWCVFFLHSTQRFKPDENRINILC